MYLFDIVSNNQNYLSFVALRHSQKALEFFWSSKRRRRRRRRIFILHL